MENKLKKAIIDCQNGRKEEFVVIYDAFVKKIYKFIYYKVGHTEAAEDLTSNTFKKALNAIDGFDSNVDPINTQGGYGASISAWLYTIARNSVTDYYRAKKENLNVEDIWGLSSEENPELDMDNKARIEEVKKYLGKISPEHREIVILRVWEEMSYKEIAAVLGKTEESCKMMFSRVIGKLRKALPTYLFIILGIKILNIWIIEKLSKF